YLKYLVVNPLGQLEVFRVTLVNIHSHSVCVGYHRNIVRRLGSALDFKAVNSSLGKLVYMVDHAKVFGVEYISTLFVLKYRVKLIGTLFFHKMISPSAWLSAFATVSVAVDKVL